MRVLAFADRRPQIADIPALIASEQIDVVCLLGDLDFSYFPGLLDTPVLKLGVYGNHCRGDYLGEWLGAHHLGGRVVGQVGPSAWRVGGLDGCPRYKPNGDHQYSEPEIEAVLASMSPYAPLDLLLTHCPPRGVNDHDDTAHRGWVALERWLARHPVRYMLHGHTYPEDENAVTLLHGCEIHYVHGHRVLDLP